MNVDNFICPICQEILIEPVVLPCKHVSCYYCLEKTLDNNKYQCFMCRKFISSWYRNSKRTNKLIDKTLWHTIQSQFPDLVKKKLNGENMDLSSIDIPVVVSSPGEIRREFDLYMQKFQDEDLTKRKKEEELSEEYIEKLHEEERSFLRQQEELYSHDEEIAKNLSIELNADTFPEQNQKPEMQTNYEEVPENSTSVLGNSFTEFHDLQVDERLARELAAEQRFLPASDIFFQSHLQAQLEADEQYARKLAAELQPRTPPPPITRLKTLHESLKLRRRKIPINRNVSIGPMDRFLERKRRTEF